jgi:hypothetical protein
MTGLARLDRSAVAAARQADADFAAGIDRGPLQGIPLAVKDNLFTADGPTTAQSVVHDPAWDTAPDATAVPRGPGWRNCSPRWTWSSARRCRCRRPSSAPTASSTGR